jgi:hypothetical protein
MNRDIRIPLATGLFLIFVTIVVVICSPLERGSSMPNAATPEESDTEGHGDSPVRGDLEHESPSWLQVFQSKIEQNLRSRSRETKQIFQFIWLSRKVDFLILTFLVSSILPESEEVFLQYVSMRLHWKLSQVSYFNRTVQKNNAETSRPPNSSQAAFS